MALILTDYDLSGGHTNTSEVVAPNNWRVSVTITEAPTDQRTFFHFEIEDEQGNWALLRDAGGHAISDVIIGNNTKSLNPIVVNAANGRVRIKPPTGGTGVANVDSINA